MIRRIWMWGAIGVFVALFMPNSGISEEKVQPPLELTGFDKNTSPGEDFFRYVNGQWLDTTEIPSDKSRWGSFVILAEKSKEAVLEIIREVSKKKSLAEGSEAQQIRDLYNSYTNRSKLGEIGTKTVQQDLDIIDSLKSKRKLSEYWAYASEYGISGPIQFWISQDARDSTQYRVYFTQGGLGLPDRDYYLENDERSVGIQESYREYLEKIFTKSGLQNAGRRSQRVYDLEKKLAAIHWTRVENRDRVRTYNKYQKAELSDLLDGFVWNQYLFDTGMDQEEEFIVRQPSFFKGLSTIIEETSLGVWKDYLRAKVISGAAPYLDDDFYDIYFDFYSRTLSGQKEPEPLEKRATSLVNSLLGEVVGKIYVDRHFPPQAKSRMLDLVKNIRIAMKESIDDLEWMDDTTKARAHEKLSKFTTKIGYPDEWRDYSELKIDPDDLMGNIRRASAFQYAREIDKLGGPIDRNEWFMTPQTVNAYYNPRMNEIVFPAAILQPPFFNLNADDAVNYGGIGMVIGHEIGHGFDDQGRKSNGDGNLTDWWTEASASAYEKRAAQLVEQYNEYQPVKGFNVNGQLTLGENIGDLGGLTLAWKAYMNSLNGKSPDPIDGFTHGQRFFISYAQIWRIKSTTEMTIRRIKTDSHSPPKFRVNGPLKNFQPFYQTFDVKKDMGMWLSEDQRVSIW